jgi:hypothetical protein
MLLVLSCFTAAQESPKIHIFSGCQFTHVALGHDINGFNLNGWNASLSGYVSKYFGASADFSGTYGSPFGVSNKTYTYLIGPVARFPNRSKMTPFGHVLFGGAHLNVSSLGIAVPTILSLGQWEEVWTSTKIQGFRYAWRRLIG